MGRCSSSRPPGLVTRQQIAVELRGLGVAAGDVLMVHAAIGSIGWIVGGIDQVLRGILDAVGETGTVMMYVGWDGSPYDVTLDLEELPAQLAAAWPPYDPATAHAVRSWGVLPEVLRRWPGAVRSDHPDHSFAAVGPRAEELVREHPLQYAMGERSPLARLCELGGKILLLGSPLAHVTLLHHAEHLASVPEKEVITYWAPILENGAKTWVRIEEFDTGSAGCLPWFGPVDMFEALVKDYIQAGDGVVGAVGAARSHLFDASGLSRFAVEWIEERYAEPIEREVDVEIVATGPDDHSEVAALFGLLDEERPMNAAGKGRLRARADEFLEDPDRRVFVARGPRTSLGILVAYMQSHERGILEQAFVDPEVRRRGILRELEIEASGWLRDRGCRTVQVHIDAGNDAARAAWKALGYESREEYLERPL